jgi:hypothetical protein
MKYVRTHGGRIVHAAGCPQLQFHTSYPWTWAETASFEDLVIIIKRFGYRQCGLCKPVGTDVGL